MINNTNKYIGKKSDLRGGANVNNQYEIVLIYHLLNYRLVKIRIKNKNKKKDNEKIDKK